MAELDVEVRRRRMEGEWLSRSKAIDLSLASFFESGGLASLDPEVTGWYWAQWEVTSAAIRRFIGTADTSPPLAGD